MLESSGWFDIDSPAGVVAAGWKGPNTFGLPGATSFPGGVDGTSPFP